MIYLSDAAGSVDLLPLFRGGARLMPLKHGDAEFWGIWSGGEAVRICCEYKKLRGLAQDMNSGRYREQIIRARQADYDFVYLFLMVEEGRFRPGHSGLWEHRQGKAWVPLVPQMSVKRMDDYVNEIDLYLGVRVRRSGSAREAVGQIINLHDLFQTPPEGHHSLEQFYTPAPPRLELFRRPSLLRRAAKEFDGVGWEKSKAVEKQFGSVEAMVRASAREWMQVEGIGKVIATKTVEDIQRDWRNNG